MEELIRDGLIDGQLDMVASLAQRLLGGNAPPSPILVADLLDHMAVLGIHLVPMHKRNLASEAYWFHIQTPEMRQHANDVLGRRPPDPN